MSDYPFNRIKATTRYCGVLGYPIKHSGSPAMHNPTMKAMGLDWNYLAFEVHPDHLREVLVGAGRMGFVGMNLTVPHKLLAYEMVDHLDASAERWGAVNTIRFEGRTESEDWEPIWKLESTRVTETRMSGYNTDADAVVRAISEELSMDLAGKSVVLLGAGGAGKVAALKLADEKVGNLFLVNRTESKCHEIKEVIDRELESTATHIGYPDSGQPVDLVINATSLGLKNDDPLPFDPEKLDLRKARHAYDMIYQPATTRFLGLASEAGCHVANGLGMLLYQGVKALEIWSEADVPVDVMKSALHQHIYQSEK